MDEAALRGAAPTAARDCAGQGDRHRHPVARPAGARPPLPAARRDRALSRDVPVSRAARGEALQAVHPRVPAAVPARQDLPLLRRLADVGNTVVVVEHDAAAMRRADWMVELGPGSGEAGGEVVYQGPAAGVREAGTLTGQYLSGEKRIGVPSARRPAARWLGLEGARRHDLRDVDVRVPLGTLTAVTGVSGSGKSTLVHDVLYRQLEARLRGTHSAKPHLGEPVGDVRALDGWEALADVVLVDQSPIGRTPRSNPITYVKAFDELRGLFAAVPQARERRYSARTLS